MPVSARAAPSADAGVVIIGDGVIGLSIALELARGGAQCTLIGARREGVASGAAAGLLAPSVGHLADGVRPFFMDSLSRYPSFVRALGGAAASLVLVEGLIDVSDSVEGWETFEALDAAQVATLEPELRAPRGARFYRRDGAVDNVLLVGALRRAIAAFESVAVIADDPVTTVELGGAQARVVLESGVRIAGDTVVLAAGAWAPSIRGLPRPLPVSPLKGQILAVASKSLTHAVMGDDVYLVPRAAEVVVGATAERAGFDISTRRESIERLRQSAIAICPALAVAAVTRTWAGIRPATPDMLPIIGRDPEVRRLIYACGHSKNGILLAPATAAAVAALAGDRESSADLAPFSIERFAAS